MSPGVETKTATRPYESALTITDDGLVLGQTVLAKRGRNSDGNPCLAIDGVEQRILGLLAVTYGEPVASGILDNIRRASSYLSQGEPVLAAIELALAGLPPLKEDGETSLRLSRGEALLAAGADPRRLIQACGLDPVALDLLKASYDPNQPRVPAGNPIGGQWTSEGSEDGEHPLLPSISSMPGVVLADYQVVKEAPSDERVVIPSDGAPVFGGHPPTLLVAPRHADYRQVFAAGRSITSMPLFDQIARIRAALHHGGTYDFQRDPTQQKISAGLHKR